MTLTAHVSQQEDGIAVMRLTGRMVTKSLNLVEKTFASVQMDVTAFKVELDALEALDTGGAFLIVELVNRLKAQRILVEITGASPNSLALIRAVESAMPEAEGEEDQPRGIVPWIEGIGAATARAGISALSLLTFFGQTLHGLGRTLIHPRRLRLAALVSQMEETGFKAIPIVFLMSFLIGIVLSFQGASQLRQFGAEVFVVDLIAISILRELGILLTAIIVAGRSGSAFTASIGSMKVREELDAMQTLGLDPIEVLVLPRVIALTIMLPVLGFIANLSGLFGGALMSWVELGVSPGMFITRLQENTDIWHLAIGMIKAPFFAVIISVVACWQAMQVQGSSESVGRHTTSSVVQSIFLVIAVDAMFSIFFAEIGV